jgi:4-amino-4-deoxy-L-arabinose transferase-like glycosyltransferase
MSEKKGVLVIFILFVLAHVLLFNINAAEWGDSYRILRASKFVRQLSYPEDEKRLPLYSIVLATWPNSVDPVFWGKLVMFVLSLASFGVFYALLKKIAPKNERTLLIALSLFAFNPVWFYWSIRIMADVPFAFIALCAFYVLAGWKERPSLLKSVLLGFITGLGVLTRFEGYLVLVSVACGLLLVSFPLKGVLKTVKNRLPHLVLFVVTAFLTVLPYFYYRNPLTSSYFEEPAGRVYDLKMVQIYLLSLMFLFGFTSAGFFVFKKFNVFIDFFKSHIGIAIFVLLELVLVLLWPAAVPRLFVPIVPLLVIPLSLAISAFFQDESQKSRLRRFNDIIVLTICLALYIGAQYLIRLQFLVIIRNVFLLVVSLQLIMIFSIIFKKFDLFLTSLFLSAVIWAFATIWIHKDIFRSVKEAAVYVVTQNAHIIAYNDVSAVSPWYLADRGTYLNLMQKEKLNYDNPPTIIPKDIA